MSDGVRLGLVGVGALLVLLALLWRYRSRHHDVRVLVRQLDDADPQERARGGILLVDLGLARAARPVLAHVTSEPDSRVRLAIALAVGRRQWEPSNTKRVRQVREWASLELEQQGQPVSSFGPAMTRLADMGGPRPKTPWQPPPDPTATASGSPSPAPDVPADRSAAPIQWGTPAPAPPDPASGLGEP